MYVETDDGVLHCTTESSRDFSIVSRGLVDEPHSTLTPGEWLVGFAYFDGRPRIVDVEDMLVGREGEVFRPNGEFYPLFGGADGISRYERPVLEIDARDVPSIGEYIGLMSPKARYLGGMINEDHDQCTSRWLWSTNNYTGSK